MKNLVLTLAFDGTVFCGWQVQPNDPSVQGALEDAIEKVTGAHSRVTGCSRTDAGVHARQFVCNFRTESQVSCAKMSAALNFYLPREIAVQQCRVVPMEFHARYHCLAKTYRYHVHNTGIRDPFLQNRATLEPFRLDETLLNQQAQHFVGTHDFASFCAAGSCVKSTVRTITSFEVNRLGDEVFFTVEGNGFLYHMVRIMVGTLLDIAKGRLALGCIPGILEACDRTQAGATAPAMGLFLWGAEYGE